MRNAVCDWICEEVLYTYLILVTFKNHKFICDQAINPKISHISASCVTKCDQACENRAYLHIKFDLIFEFQLTISFEVQMLLQSNLHALFINQ